MAPTLSSTPRARRVPRLAAPIVALAAAIAACGGETKDNVNGVMDGGTTMQNDVDAGPRRELRIPAPGLLQQCLEPKIGQPWSLVFECQEVAARIMRAARECWESERLNPNLDDPIRAQGRINGQSGGEAAVILDPAAHADFLREVCEGQNARVLTVRVPEQRPNAPFPNECMTGDLGVSITGQHSMGNLASDPDLASIEASGDCQ